MTSYAVRMHYGLIGGSPRTPGPMTLAEILRAVDEGLPVHWQTTGYVIERPTGGGGCVIRSLSTGHCIGLTWADGVTLNGKEEDFFIGGETMLRPSS